MIEHALDWITSSPENLTVYVVLFLTILVLAGLFLYKTYFKEGK